MSETRTILFLCPHGAATSVMAAAYFQRLAEQRGLDVSADAAGTEPDAEVSPAVLELLNAEGIDVANYRPRRVSAEELAAADHIVSFGCDLGDLAPPRAIILRWDDVPAVSQDLRAARDAIRARVESLIDALG
jgi:protein-tyrosine-phosphatase